jgi:hypothetical protein
MQLSQLKNQNYQMQHQETFFLRNYVTSPHQYCRCTAAAVSQDGAKNALSALLLLQAHARQLDHLGTLQGPLPRYVPVFASRLSHECYTHLKHFA